MIWTKRGVQQLQDKAAQAQSRIRDLFVRTAIHLDAEQWAWGQFLDESRDNTQHGVYGTSAGLQALTLAGYSARDPLISGADLALKRVFDIGEDDRVFLEHDDIFILYKMAYLAEAAAPGQPTISDTCKPVEEIVKNVLPERGWGEFFYSDTEKDEHPKAMPTSVALLAISRFRAFRLQAECEGALAWLCQRVIENGSLGPHEYALACLALYEYRDVGLRIPTFNQAMSRCKDRITEWAKKRRRREIGEQKNYWYSTCMEGHRENRYMFFLPDCLVSLALLKFENPVDTRRYVLNVIDHFASHVINNSGYITKSTEKISSVDQMWICRLMKAFKDVEANSVLPLYFFLWSGANTPIRILLSTAFASIGIIAGYFTLHLDQKDVAWRVGLGAVATVSVALFARTLWEFIFNRQKQ